MPEKEISDAIPRFSGELLHISKASLALVELFMQGAFTLGTVLLNSGARSRSWFLGEHLLPLLEPLGKFNVHDAK